MQKIIDAIEALTVAAQAKTPAWQADLACARRELAAALEYEIDRRVETALDQQAQRTFQGAGQC